MSVMTSTLNSKNVHWLLEALFTTCSNEDNRPLKGSSFFQDTFVKVIEYYSSYYCTQYEAILRVDCYNSLPENSLKRIVNRIICFFYLNVFWCVSCCQKGNFTWEEMEIQKGICLTPHFSVSLFQKNLFCLWYPKRPLSSHHYRYQINNTCQVLFLYQRNIN